MDRPADRFLRSRWSQPANHRSAGEMLNRRYLTSRDVGPSNRGGNSWIWILVILFVIGVAAGVITFG
jgi:hypothetical protein